MRGRAFHHHPDLASAAQAATARAAETGRSQWLAVTVPVPCGDALAAWSHDDHADRFYWEVPARREQVAAFGALLAIEPEGPGRFGSAADQTRALRDDLHVADPIPDAGRVPILVGGFAFDDRSGGGDGSDGNDWSDFPATRLVLPEAVLHRGAGAAWLGVHVEVAPGDAADDAGHRLEARLDAFRRAIDRPPHRHRSGSTDFRACADAPQERYEATVAAALDAIAAGDLEKVVVARSVSLQRPGGFEPAAILDDLRRRHPSCASFAVARGDRIFLGATPERLLELNGRLVSTAAVAGSARRGRSPEEDREHAEELTESKKEQAEHAVVVRALREALEPVCRDLDVSEAPRLMKLEGIQHLETPVRGTLREEASLLELAGRLHPTPAVGGAPRTAALAWLAEHEGLDRGWYAGPVGVVRRDGGGELWVALRSALLGPGSARLFAGAGIVAGAVPRAELRETQLKLRAMLDVLVDL